MSPEERAIFIFTESVRLVRNMYAMEDSPRIITRQLRNDLECTYRILNNFLSVCMAEAEQPPSEKEEP